MRTGFDRYRYVDRAIVLAGHSLAQSHTNVIDDFDSFAVDEKLDLLAWNIGPDTKVLNRKLVLTIGRKVVTNQHSSASAQRKTLDMMSLSDIARCDVAG